MMLPAKAVHALVNIKKSLLSDEVAEKATEASTEGRRVEKPTPRTFKQRTITTRACQSPRFWSQFR
jgi:hypothetical protein